MTFSDYVGIPYRAHGTDRGGVYCYGLLQLVYAEMLGIDLPSRDHIADYGVVRGEAIRDDIEAGIWREVDEPKPFDAVLYRMLGNDFHIGIATSRRHVLHANRPQVVIIPFSDPKWTRRLTGIYRHEALT